MKLSTKIVIWSIAISLISSCKKDNNFPDTPELTVREFRKTGTYEALWVIGFTDGDGNVGVRNEQDADNFIVDIWLVENGVAYQDTAIDAEDYRVPVVENIRTEKGIEGEIRFEINGLDFLRAAGVDSLYYSGFLVDRAGNESNVVQTPTFTTN